MKKTILLLSTVLGGLIANAQNPYPILTIDSIQYVNPTKLGLPGSSATATLPDYIDPVKKNSTYGDTVRFEGIVISNPKAYGLSISRKGAYVQIKGGGPWSGVLVNCDPAIQNEPAFRNPATSANYTIADFLTDTKFYQNTFVGYKSRFTGIIRNFQGETQINLIPNNPNWDNSVELLSLTPDTLVYTEITADQLMLGNPNSSTRDPQKTTGEKYEGTLVRLKDITVYDVVNSISGSTNRTAWSVIDDFGNVIEIRDFSAYYRRDDNGDSTGLNAVDQNRFVAPPIGARLSYLQGVVTEYQVAGKSRYGIAPIYPGDFKVCNGCKPTIKLIERTPSIVKSTDSTKFNFEITVEDTTLSISKLFYKNSVTNTLDSIVMTRIPSTDNYIATIPPTNTECVMTYWVKATDNRNRTTLIPDPFAFGNKYYITGANGVDDIRVLQTSVVPSGASVWSGDSLSNMSVRGIVTGRNFGNMLTVQAGRLTVQAGRGPNSAIFVQRRNATDSLTNWQVGDSVLITNARVNENFNVTTLFNALGNVISSGNTLPAFERNLSLDSFSVGSVSYSRKWEGVLMRFDSVEVSSKNPDENNTPPGDFGEFAVKKGTGLNLRIDDLNANFRNYNKLVNVGMKMSYIQGPMYFANGNFKLIPRNAADADFSNIDTIKPIITIIGANPFSVKKDSVYTDLGATANDDKDGNITSKIVKSGVVNTAIAGTYIISYSVKDLAGNMDSVVRTVNVIAPDVTKPVITITGKTQDTLMQGKTYVDLDATATDNIDGNITNKITKVSTLDSSKLGTYTITYSVSDLAGNSASAVRTIVVVKNTGVNEVNKIASNLNIYPSPAFAELNVSIENINQLPAQLVITDILGKEVLKQTINAKNFNEVLNISQLNNGVYILNISNANGMQTVKFMVSGK